MSDTTTYFDDPQLDRAMGLVFQLAAELHVTTQRLHALEALLVRHGVLATGELDQFQPDAQVADKLAAVRDAAMGRLLRVITEDGPAQHPLRDELVPAEALAAHE